MVTYQAPTLKVLKMTITKAEVMTVTLCQNREYKHVCWAWKPQPGKTLIWGTVLWFTYMKCILYWSSVSAKIGLGYFLWNTSVNSRYSNWIAAECSEYPANIYLFQFNNRNTRKKFEICSKLTMKTPERRYWRRSALFIVNFEHISHLFVVFLLLTLNRLMLAG